RRPPVMDPWLWIGLFVLLSYPASAPRQPGPAAPAVAEPTADPGCRPDPRPVRLGRSAAGLRPGRDPAGQAAAAGHPALRLVFPQCLPESDAADAGRAGSGPAPATLVHPAAGAGHAGR